MINSPACVDALESRLATNITSGQEHHRGRVQWFIEAKGFSHPGHGITAAAAAADFLKRNNLEA
ncbi:hypothetical protein EHM76_04665 [bacterium]|nr:MAG: hypothetical protein EHM76_04665 [bacterium]